MNVEYKIEEIREKLKIELAKVPFVNPDLVVEAGKEVTVGIPVTVPPAMIAKLGTEINCQTEMTKGAVSEVINQTFKELWMRVASYNQKPVDIESKDLAKMLVDEECYVLTSGRVAAEILEHADTPDDLPMMVVSNYTVMTIGKGVMIIDPFLKWGNTPALYSSAKLINAEARKIGTTSNAFYVGAQMQVSPLTMEIKTDASKAEFTRGYNVVCAAWGSKTDAQLQPKDTPGISLTGGKDPKPIDLKNIKWYKGVKPMDKPMGE